MSLLLKSWNSGMFAIKFWRENPACPQEHMILLTTNNGVIIYTPDSNKNSLHLLCFTVASLCLPVSWPLPFPVLAPAPEVGSLPTNTCISRRQVSAFENVRSLQWVNWCWSWAGCSGLLLAGLVVWRRQCRLPQWLRVLQPQPVGFCCDSCVLREGVFLPQPRSTMKCLFLHTSAYNWTKMQRHFIMVNVS